LQMLSVAAKWCERLVVAVLATAACVAAGGAIPGSSPRITLSDPARDYELRAAALSPDGATIHMISAAYSKGRPSDSVSLIWTIADASGRVVSQRDPLAMLPPADAASLAASGPDAGTGLALTSDGGAFLVLQNSTGDVRLVRLPRATESAIARVIDVGGRAPVIRRVLTTPTDHLLLVGSVGTQPLVATLSTDGKVLTRYELHEDVMTIVSAVVDADGGAVVVGEKGVFPDATTWVGRLSARGDVLKTTEFPGQPADIARGGDGTYLVLIEKTGAAASEMLAKGLGPDLAERWARSLVTGVRGGTSFRASPVRTGGFIVAGTKNRGLWVSRLKADGTEAWTDASDPASSPEMEMVSHLELVSARDIFAAAYSASVVVGREQRRVARAIRFTAN
jgi:hypothetical protein